MASAFEIPARLPSQHFNNVEVARGGMHTGGLGHEGFRIPHIQPIFPNMPHAVTPGNIGGDHAPSTLALMFGGT